MKKYKTKLATLVALFAFSLSAATLTAAPVAATAEEYSPSSVFSAGAGATVGASEGENPYVQFTIEEGGVVNYRHDLALKWYEEANKASYFSTEFSFPELNFKTFTLNFESAQENITKDGITKNAIVFTAEDNKVTAAVKNEDVLGEAKEIAVDGDIKVAFTNEAYGDYTVSVGDTEIGTLTNIGGYFMEYISSTSSSSRIPLSYKCELAEGKTRQLVILKSLNGQTFELKSGKIVDNKAPALVVNETVNMFPLAYRFNLAYEVVDVLDSSVTETREYAMYKAPAEGEEAKELSYSSISTSTYLLPQSEESEKELVSIRFKLDDGRTVTDEEGKDEWVYLDWYCPKPETVGEGDKAKSFIPVVRDTLGAKYTCVDNNEETATSTLNADSEALKAYQAEVDKASEKLSAGEGAYFYLPSLRELIQDDNTDYRNLKFSVYYKNQTSSSSQSSTSLNYNALRFEVDKEGAYSFRVLATDKLSNSIQVYDEDGRLVNVTGENIWDLDCIPQFNFTAASSGATIEEGEEQSIGYLDSTYTVSSFDIVALTGYEVNYKLYYFEQGKFIEDGNSMPTYSSMVKDPTQIDAKYLTEIRAYDDSVTEDDAAWENTDNEYEWRSSSLSFRPQKSGFYFVKAEVTDSVYWKEPAVGYQVVEVRNPIDVVQGETYWLQNNIASIVLFSISAVLLVAIIVLFLVHPGEKKVEEVDLTKLKGKKKE